MNKIKRLTAQCGIPNSGGEPKPYLDKCLAELTTRRELLLEKCVKSLNRDGMPDATEIGEKLKHVKFENPPGILERVQVMWGERLMLEYWPKTEAVLSSTRPRILTVTMFYQIHV